MFEKYPLQILLCISVFYFSSGQLSAQEMDEATGALRVERFCQSEGEITDCGKHFDYSEESQAQEHQNQNSSKHQTTEPLAQVIK